MANQKGDTVSTGHFWNRCIDAVNKKFETYSFWHKASDCEFDDGGNAQTKVGAFKGITSDLNTTTTGYAADMTTVAKLNSSLTANGAQLYMDYHDGKYGVNTDPKRGADTFIPFHSGGFVFCGGSQQILRTNWTYLDYSFKFNYCKADTVSFANNIITFLQLDSIN